MNTSTDEHLAECGRLHGHICPGQLLGVRMALLGCKLIEVDDPKGADRKKLIVWVEIDRCMTDAVSAVTGVRLGRRSLKFSDYGKVAATFLNAESGRAFRIAARDDARRLADQRYPAIEVKKDRQMKAYLEATDDELFSVKEVIVKLQETDVPGRPRSRVACSLCGEGINDGREEFDANGSAVCKPCFGLTYYEELK